MPLRCSRHHRTAALAGAVIKPEYSVGMPRRFFRFFLFWESSGKYSVLRAASETYRAQRDGRARTG